METATTAGTETRSAATIDTEELTCQVKDMYHRVATAPEGDFHFEMGRDMAERLGYSGDDLNWVPTEAMASFAGVGYHFGLADLKPGERVIDLGSGSGMDTFVAARHVAPSGRVTGIDMTAAQRDKAERLRIAAGFENIDYRPGYIEGLPFDGDTFDCVISNGVINLVVDKDAVFAEAARILKPGGRLALSDIVTEAHLPDGVVGDVNLWAACIGGAMQREDYQAAIERAGLTIACVQPNPQYQFLGPKAQGAQRRFGVSSISVLAIKN